MQGVDTQFIITEFDIETDVALSVYVKYYKQVIDSWLCVYVRYGMPPYYDPYSDIWRYDFMEVLPRTLSRAGKLKNPIVGLFSGNTISFPHSDLNQPLPQSRNDGCVK